MPVTGPEAWARCGALNLYSQVGAAFRRGPRSTREQLPAHKVLAQDHINRRRFLQDRPDPHASIFDMPLQRRDGGGNGQQAGLRTTRLQQIPGGLPLLTLMQEHESIPPSAKLKCPAQEVVSRLTSLSVLQGIDCLMRA